MNTSIVGVWGLMMILYYLRGFQKSRVENHVLKITHQKNVFFSITGGYMGHTYNSPYKENWNNIYYGVVGHFLVSRVFIRVSQNASKYAVASVKVHVASFIP